MIQIHTYPMSSANLLISLICEAVSSGLYNWTLTFLTVHVKTIQVKYCVFLGLLWQHWKYISSYMCGALWKIYIRIIKVISTWLMHKSNEAVSYYSADMQRMFHHKHAFYFHFLCFASLWSTIRQWRDDICDTNTASNQVPLLVQQGLKSTRHHMGDMTEYTISEP